MYSWCFATLLSAFLHCVLDVVHFFGGGVDLGAWLCPNKVGFWCCLGHGCVLTRWVFGVAWGSFPLVKPAQLVPDAGGVSATCKDLSPLWHMFSNMCM